MSPFLVGLGLLGFVRADNSSGVSDPYDSKFSQLCSLYLMRMRRIMTAVEDLASIGAVSAAAT